MQILLGKHCKAVSSKSFSIVSFMTRIKPGQLDNLPLYLFFLLAQKCAFFHIKLSLKPGVKKEGQRCFAFQLVSELLKQEGRVFPTEPLFQKINTLKDKEVFSLMGAEEPCR